MCIRDRDGTIGNGYTITKAYDISQTRGPKVLPPQQHLPEEIKMCIRDSPVGCLPGVFRYANPQNRTHVTEKPLQLMRDLVKICVCLLYTSRCV